MQFLIYILIISIGFITNLLSVDTRVRIGKLIGNVLILLSSKRRKITYNNISNAFPNKTKYEINIIMRNSYQNLGITLVELLYLKNISEDEVSSLVEFENFSLIGEKLKSGKGILFLSGHYGNWELLAFSAGLFTRNEHEKELSIVVKPQKNKRLNLVLNQYRSKFGNKLISSRNSAANIIKKIRNNELVAIVADQKAVKNRDIYIDFLGRKSLTYIAPAKLAIKYNVPVIYGIIERQDNNKYKAKLYEVEYEDIKDEPNAVELLTIRQSNVLENQIITNPNQWAWQHNRWK